MAKNKQRYRVVGFDNNGTPVNEGFATLAQAQPRFDALRSGPVYGYRVSLREYDAETLSFYNTIAGFKG